MRAPGTIRGSAVETPWNPATSTRRPSSSASWIRRARTSTIFALPCTVSVTMPACEPVSEIASWPRSSIAIAASAHEIRSPTEISMSSSRGFGRGETLCASATSSSVVCPIAERTATTRLPPSRAAAIRRGTPRSRSGSATDVPPNFITTVPARAAGAAGATAGTASYSVAVIAKECMSSLRSDGYNYGMKRPRDTDPPASCESLVEPPEPRWIVAILALVSIALLPWVLWLTVTLPSRHVSEHWDAAWVGLDVGEILAFTLTAYAAWRRAPWLQGAAAAAGTLLLVDAWFDVLLSTGDEKIWIAVGQAVFSEIPLAILCFWIAWDTARFWGHWQGLVDSMPSRSTAEGSTASRV